MFIMNDLSHERCNGPFADGASSAEEDVMGEVIVSSIALGLTDDNLSYDLGADLEYCTENAAEMPMTDTADAAAATTLAADRGRRDCRRETILFSKMGLGWLNLCGLAYGHHTNIIGITESLPNVGVFVGIDHYHTYI
jgi:hypothetical protein